MRNNENNGDFYYCDKCDLFLVMEDKEDHIYCHSLEEEEPLEDNNQKKNSEKETEEIKRLMRESTRAVKYKIDNPLTLPKDKKDCVICIEEFQKKDIVVSLPCLHLFHKQCIINWLKKNSSCPLCKYEVVYDKELETDDEKKINLFNFKLDSKSIEEKFSQSKEYINDKFKKMKNKIITKKEQINDFFHNLWYKSSSDKEQNDN